MMALTFSRFGGADVIEYIQMPDPILKEGEVLVEMKAIGFNFADIYRRQGNYHLVGSPPYIAGYEGAGIIIDANNVADYQIGDAVCFADVPMAQAEMVAVPLSHIIPLPNAISFEAASAILLQGLTAQYLTEDSYSISKNDQVLIHACAGGVGQTLVQICKMKGAKVFGLTSNENKKSLAILNGCDTVFLYHENWVQSSKDAGITVVYESVGTTLLQSFDAVASNGTIVFYGFAGGTPPLVDPRMLMDTSKKLVGGDLWCYLTTHDERMKRSKELFNWIQSGQIRVPTPTIIPLKDGRKAHELLESRMSTGKVILVPKKDTLHSNFC